MSNCEHQNFAAKVNVIRLTPATGERVTGFSAEVTIECAYCGVDFAFLGLPHTVNSTVPGVSIDALEARLPIAPANSHVFRK
jgi:hypothetical protein